MDLLFFCVVVGVVVISVIWVLYNKDGDESQPEAQVSETPSDEELLRNANAMMAKIEALIQASEMGHDDVHQQIEDGTYTGPWPERRNDGAWTSIFDDLRILSIAGINHRQSISHYKGRNTVALVPEPNNEFDANAIKVIAEDGHHLGYIKREHTEMVRAWACGRFPFYCIARIEEHDDEDDGHRFYTGYLYIKTAGVMIDSRLRLY